MLLTAVCFDEQYEPLLQGTLSRWWKKKKHNNPPIQPCTALVLWFMKSLNIISWGCRDKVLQHSGGLDKHIVDYFLLYSGAPRTVRVWNVCHMTAANWEAFTDGPLSKMHSCMVRLMLWLARAYMPAVSTGLARGNDRAYRVHYKITTYTRLDVFIQLFQI